MNRASVQITFLIVIASIIATAIFGFTVMSEPGHVMAGCFGSTPGAVCSMLSLIEHFTAHLHAFKSISTAVMRTSSLLTTLLLIVLARLALAIKQVHDSRKKYFVQRKDQCISPQRFQLIHWLALHEKRDPSFACAVNS